MSVTDQKRSAHSFQDTLDDLQTLNIPENPENDLGASAIAVQPDDVEQIKKEAQPLSSFPSIHLGSIDLGSENVLDQIADGIDLTVKGLADKLKKLDQKLTKMVSGDEEVELLKFKPLPKKKVKKTKKIAGKEIEVEEYEAEAPIPALNRGDTLP